MSTSRSSSGRWSWSKVSVGAIVAIARIASAQTTLTTPNELCALGLASSALVEDTIYLDGGYMSWSVGSGAQQKIEDSPLQVLFQVNLTQPMNFTAETNYSSIVKTTEKPNDSMAPSLFNGHMLANAYQLILFGGAIERTDSIQIPDNKWAISKDIRKRDPVPLQKPGDWRTMSMVGATRGIVGGAYVNIPSEDKAIVIAGSRTTGWNDVQYVAERPENSADEMSTQVIIADLHEMKTETFENITFTKDDFSERSGGEAVWIPTGEQGTVVMLGGTGLTFYMANNDTIVTSQSYVEKMRNWGKELMTKVAVFDVKNKRWYRQETTGEAPRETSEFCAVPVTSQDGSVHNIYVYGGTTGIHRRYVDNLPLTDSIFPDPTSDDVHVLSLPSFTWTKIHAGNTEYARHGHRCHRISADRFMVVGGISHTTAGSKCVKEFVRVFDMSSGTFVNTYNPATLPKEYKLPVALQKTLEASETGANAKNTAPGKWASDNLKTLFSTKYPKKPYAPWPYPAVNPDDGKVITNITDDDVKVKSNGLPNYVPPLLGAILGLLVVITILCLVLFWLKKKKAQQKRLMSDSAASTVVNNRRTWSWLIGTQHNEKGHYAMDDDFEGRTPSGTEQGDMYDGSTVTGPMSPVDGQGHHQLQGHYQLVGREREAHGHGRRVASEVDGGEIYEMPGERISEMPAEAVNRKTVNWEDQGVRPGHVSHFSEQLSPQLPGQAGSQRNSDPLSPLSPMK